MKSDPCARLMTRMIPKTSVTPTAIRKSIMPSCRPLKNCSTRICRVIRAPSSRVAGESDHAQPAGHRDSAKDHSAGSHNVIFSSRALAMTRRPFFTKATCRISLERSVGADDAHLISAELGDLAVQPTGEQPVPDGGLHL